MPPVIIWVLGAVGALLIAVAARKANADLENLRRERAVERPVEKLERDPITGEYRPRNS
jgi:hypothetical protein